MPSAPAALSSNPGEKEVREGMGQRGTGRPGLLAIDSKVGGGDTGGGENLGTFDP